MNDLKIFLAAKKSFHESVDVEYYLSTLFKYPENKWFAPTNWEKEGYSICRDLATFNIIATRRIPMWREGTFSGIKNEFYYVKSLDYSKSQ